MRRSTISTETPSASSACAASSARCTIAPYVTIETSSPSRLTSATPIGIRRVRILRHLLADPPVDPLVFQEHHGVVVTDRRLHQALRVGGERRTDHLDPARVREPRLGVDRVERRRADHATGGPTEHHRKRDAAAVVDPRQRGRDLVEPAGHEVGVLELRDGAEAFHRGADRHPDHRLFRDGRVHHALGTEPFEEPLGDLERAAVGADVFAEHVDALVALHLLPERFCDRHEVGRLAILGALPARFRAVAGSSRFDGRGSRHEASVPPPRPGSLVQ